MTLRPHDLVLEDEDVQAAMALQTRSVSEEQIRRFESYVADIFSAFGLDLDTPGTRDTPRRFVRALFDVTAGYDGDPKLLTAFQTECSGGPDCQLSQIIEGPIQFFSLCEHHALPFHGQAYLGYIAHEHIIGISKLTRLVRLFAQRFSVQERLGRQLFDAASGDEVPLPPELSIVYGALRLPRYADRAHVISNFVTTLDGVTSWNEPGQSGGGEISGFNAHDRLVMGLLRAVADAVVVGAGTLRSVPRHVWTAEHVYPDLAEVFRGLRVRLGKSPAPLNVVVTSLGRIDLNWP